MAAREEVIILVYIYLYIIMVGTRASFGTAGIETLIFTGFEQKRYLVKFEVMGPHRNLFQS